MPVEDVHHSQYISNGSRINPPELPPRIDRQLKPSGSGLELGICNTMPDSRIHTSEDMLVRSVPESLFDKPVDGDETQVEYMTCMQPSTPATNVTATNPTADLTIGSGVGMKISNNPDEITARLHSSLERQAQGQGQGRLNVSTKSKITSSLISGGSGSNLGTAVPSNSIFENDPTYDSYNHSQFSIQTLGRLGPNAPDDLKSVPNVK